MPHPRTSLPLLLTAAALAACSASAVDSASEPRPATLGVRAQALSQATKDACAFRFDAASGVSLPSVSALATKGFAANASPVLVADVNGDGHGDLVIATAGNALTTLLGAGNGSFAAGVTSTVPVAAGRNVEGLQPVTVGDFDGDGHDDVVVVSSTSDPAHPQSWSGRFIVMYGGSGAALTGVAQAAYTISAGNGTVWHLAADLDQDGKDDLFVGNFGSETVLFGSATRTLGPSIAAWPNANGSSRSAEIVLRPKTGRPAIGIVTLGPTAKLTCAANHAVTVAQNTTPNMPGVRLVAGDFDGDGTIDLASNEFGALDVASVSGGAISKLLVSSASVRTALDLDGDGSDELVYEDGAGDLYAACGFVPGATEMAARALGVSLGANDRILTTGDVNGDGLPDLLVGTASAPSLYLSGAKPTPSAASPLRILSTTGTTTEEEDAGTSDAGGTRKDAGSSKRDAGARTDAASDGGDDGDDDSASNGDGPSTDAPPSTTDGSSGCALGGRARAGFAEGALFVAAALAARLRRRSRHR